MMASKRVMHKQQKSKNNQLELMAAAARKISIAKLSSEATRLTVALAGPAGVCGDAIDAPAVTGNCTRSPLASAAKCTRSQLASAAKQIVAAQHTSPIHKARAQTWRKSRSFPRKQNASVEPGPGRVGRFGCAWQALSFV